MFIKITNVAGDSTVFLNLNQVIFVNKQLGMIRTSDGDNICISEECLEDVLNTIGYNYDEED